MIRNRRKQEQLTEISVKLEHVCSSSDSDIFVTVHGFLFLLAQVTAFNAHFCVLFCVWAYQMKKEGFYEIGLWIEWKFLERNEKNLSFQDTRLRLVTV